MDKLIANMEQYKEIRSASGITIDTKFGSILNKDLIIIKATI